MNTAMDVVSVVLFIVLIMYAAIKLDEAFPSPYSGILFLLVFHVYYADYRRSGFRPLIQGFFFYSQRL